MFQLTNLRAAAAIAVLGAMALAGCGGGSSQSLMPVAQGATASSNVPTMPTQNGGKVATGTLSITLPNHTGAQAQSSTRASLVSSAKKPAYIDTTTANSALVVSVTPQNAAEAAQYGNLTICYNLYTNGTLAASSANFTVTPTVPGGNVASTVLLTVPAPPGTDGYQITQYAGQCGSTPYTIPVAPVGLTGSNVLAQTPVTYADIEPGVINNLNNQIANCPLGSATVACPAVLAGAPVPPAGTFAASVTIASVAFGAVPIPSPVREQGAFIAATGRIGVPIPLEAKDAAGSVIPGLTTAAAPLAGAGFFPTGVTVTTSDAVNTTLNLVDATTGAIAQTGASVTIHEFNVLNSNTVTGFTNVCGTGAQSCSDTTGGGTQGDPWVLVLTYNGVDASKVTSVTVTATATVANAALPAPITTVITPQSSVYTAVAAGTTGYVDTAAPVAPLALIQPIAAGAVFFTDGNQVKQDGVNTPSAAEGTTLTGLSYAAVTTPMLYAVDNAVAGGNLAPSGLYAFNPAALGASGTAVVTQDSTLTPVQFAKPVASFYAPDIHGGSKLYVVDSNGVEIVDIVQATQTATDVGPCNLTSGTALSAPPTGVKLLGTAAAPAGASFLVADPGAVALGGRIAQVTVNQFNCSITTYASGQPFTGITALAGGALYATTSAGQIYYVSGSGATPVSLALTTAAAASTIDGPVGQLSALGAAPTGTLTPTNYPLQFQSGSFFDTAHAFAGVAPYAALAPPYTVAPFGGTQAFTLAPAIAGFVADTSAGATTGAGKVNATGGLIVVPAGAVAGGVITPDSILFVDSGTKLRTLVR